MMLINQRHRVGTGGGDSGAVTRVGEEGPVAGAGGSARLESEEEDHLEDFESSDCSPSISG